MSSQSLPTELWLQVISYLTSDIDKQCLRITSRSFLILIPRCNQIEAQSLPFSQYSRRRIQLLDRLTRPGNILHDTNLPVCLHWCKFAQKSGFGIPCFSLNGHEVCYNCIARVLPKAPQLANYDEESYLPCEGCYIYVKKGDLQEHHGNAEHLSGHQKRLLCRPCHAGTCRDHWCAGWPRGYVSAHSDVFFRNKKKLQKYLGGTCGCVMCVKRKGGEIHKLPEKPSDQI